MVLIFCAALENGLIMLLFFCLLIFIFLGEHANYFPKAAEV